MWRLVNCRFLSYDDRVPCSRINLRPQMAYFLTVKFLPSKVGHGQWGRTVWALKVQSQMPNAAIKVVNPWLFQSVYDAQYDSRTGGTHARESPGRCWQMAAKHKQHYWQRKRGHSWNREFNVHLRTLSSTFAIFPDFIESGQGKTAWTVYFLSL